jgi:multiple sugar transport system permease protein
MSILQRKERRGSHLRTDLLGYFFIAPAMILYLLFNIWPIIRGFLMAFTDYRFIYPETRWEFNGLDNFIRMTTDRRVVESLTLSLQYAALVVPITILLALLVAVLVSRVNTGAGFYRWVVYLPTILPIAVSFLTFSELYGHKFGYFNSVLRNMGVEDPPNWLGSVSTALPSIGIAHVWVIFGFPTILFLIGIYNIGASVYEAASIDGANEWQQFRFITLPLLKPIMAMVLILTVPGIIGVTDPMLILTNGGPQDSTRTLGLYLYQVAFQRGDLRLGYASAISLTLSVCISLVVAIIFWWSREDR